MSDFTAILPLAKAVMADVMDAQAEKFREEGRRALAERIGAVLRNHENSRKALEQINDICYPWLK